MIHKNKLAILVFLTTLAMPIIPAIAQQSEVVRGRFVYRLLDAQRACVDLYAGKTFGANYISDAWHSPIPGNHNRCKYKYVTTWQNQAGWKGGASGVVVSGEVNGSHGDNGNTNFSEDVINIPRNQACSQQQGTAYSVVPRSGYIYCRHNR